MHGAVKSTTSLTLKSTKTEETLYLTTNDTMGYIIYILIRKSNRKH